MKVDFDEKFFLMKVVLMNLYFTLASPTRTPLRPCLMEHLLELTNMQNLTDPPHVVVCFLLHQSTFPCVSTVKPPSSLNSMGILTSPWCVPIHSDRSRRNLSITPCILCNSVLRSFEWRALFLLAMLRIGLAILPSLWPIERARFEASANPRRLWPGASWSMNWWHASNLSSTGGTWADCLALRSASCNDFYAGPSAVPRH